MHSVRVGGDAMDTAIINYIRRSHNLLNEKVILKKLKAIGVAAPPSSGDGKVLHIKEDLLKGVPKEVVINQNRIKHYKNRFWQLLKR